MVYSYSNSPNGVTSTEIVTALAASSASGAIVVGAPVQLYRNSSGVLCACSGLVDASSLPGRYGIALEAASANTTEIKVVKKGAATIVSGGTADQQITAISASGGATTAAVASGNADLSLGYCTSATGIVLY